MLAPGGYIIALVWLHFWGSYHWLHIVNYPENFLWFTTKDVSEIKPIVVEHSNSTCAGQTLRKDKGHLSLFLPFLYEGVVQRVEVAMTTTSCVLQVYQYQQQHGLAAIVLSDALELL